MLDYSFGFWQMLLMLFIVYHLAIFITAIRLTAAANRAKPVTVRIDITRIGDIWYAFEEESKKFLVQSMSYKGLQEKLNELSSNTTYIIEETKLNDLLGDSKDAGSI